MKFRGLLLLIVIILIASDTIFVDAKSKQLVSKSHLKRRRFLGSEAKAHRSPKSVQSSAQQAFLK